MSFEKLWDGGNDEARADIWLVHGLRGDKLKTWTKGDVCWPKDLLPNDVPGCRIFTWSYDSQVANIRTSASHATIFGHAESLLQDICMTREDDEISNRPILFVGHSLGGLVIKEALIRSSEYLFNQQDEDLGAVYAATKGVVFLGTPHRGSELTPYGHIVSKIARIAFRQPNEALISLLETESPILEKQRRSFASISKDLGLACLYEEEPTSLGIVVPEWSAVIDGFNVKQHPIPGDHIEMCKFLTKDDTGYLRVKFMIRTILKRELRARQQVLAVMNNALLLSLEFASMEAREDDLDMEPAHRGTFRWIMEPDATTVPPKSSPLIEWLRSEDSLFWLSGKAGSGKSTLMQYIITHHKLSQILEEAFPEKHRIVAWHYLYERGKDPLQKSREGLLRHLLYHIISQNTSLALPIFKSLKTSRSFDHEKVWTWKELKSALEVVLAGLPADTVVLFFIDGLDEYRPIRKLQNLDVDDDADEETSAKLAEVINDGHQEIVDLVRSLSRYKNVRMCISSRPLIVFRDSLAGCKNMELHTLTAGDISKYVADRLAENELLSQLTVLEPTFEDEVKKEILAKADGVFLWVKLVLTVLVRGLKQRDTVEELLQKLRLMPKELGGKDGLYMAMLRNISLENRKDGYAYFQVFQRSEDDLDPLLLSFAMDKEHEVYAVESEPLPAREVTARSVRTADRLVSRCGGLLELRRGIFGNGINFIHQTAKEFVMQQSNWEVLLGSNQQREFDGALALQRASVMLLKRSKPCFRDGGKGSAGLVWNRLRTSLVYASITEERSRVASAKLILLADRIMFNLCRPEYLCDYTLTDYGSLNVFGIPRGEQPIPTLYDLTSHLRSTEPKANVVSPLWPVHWSVLDPLSSDTPKDKNLISVAVQTNLTSFLDLMMDSSLGMSKFFTSEYPLLAYALIPYRLPGTQIDDLDRLGRDQCGPEVTSQLLQAGHSPNQVYCGPVYHCKCTVWQGFLVYGDFLFDPYTRSFEATGKAGGRAEYKTWTDNAMLLILYGADLTVTSAVVDQVRYIKDIETHYPRRSPLFIVVTILWRASRTIGWKKEILEILMLKGAKLRENEKEKLLELAETLQVPQPLVRSVSEIVLEGRASNKTLSDLQSGNGNYLVVTNSSFSRSRSSGIATPELSGRPSNASSEMRPRSESLGVGFDAGGRSPGNKWARRQKEAKKRLKAFFGHGHD